MRILIGADLVPTESNFEYFKSGDTDTLLGKELKSILDGGDLRIFNLEVPLTDTFSPIAKCGPNLIAPTDTVAGYKSVGADLLTMANNHIMDQGEQGLVSTVKLLEDNGIAYLGAGANLSEARKPYIINDGDRKIGIYACAEHEFSIATENKAGANPFDALESPDHIANLKSECDYVIVLYHGGKEHYRYPSPNLQKICRKLCEKGADLVVCQHSHCIGCEEKVGDATVVYGQGNFLFDHSKSEFWQTSLLIEVDTDNNEIKYIPLRKDGFKVRVAEDGEEILKQFEKRTSEIKDASFVEGEYRKFASRMKKNYLMTVCGTNIFYRVLNKLSGYKLKYNIPKKRELAIKNYLDCEAHNELFSKSLEDN
ncbi:MAG: CapA family protein [Clostridia bacterium]|nr:CapA family protein [Clostridia bacterium]